MIILFGNYKPLNNKKGYFLIIIFNKITDWLYIYGEEFAFWNKSIKTVFIISNSYIVWYTIINICIDTYVMFGKKRIIWTIFKIQR